MYILTDKIDLCKQFSTKKSDTNKGNQGKIIIFVIYFTAFYIYTKQRGRNSQEDSKTVERKNHSQTKRGEKEKKIQ